MGRFYGLFRAISLLDGMLFNYFLLKFAESHFTLMFALIGLMFGLGFVMMCMNVKEGEYPPPPPVSDDPRSRGFFGAMRIYLRECFSQPYYRWCIAAITLGHVTFVPFNSFSVYYYKHLNMSTDLYGKLTAYSYLTSLCLAYPLGWMVDKFHALRIALAAMALYALSTAYGFLFTHNPETFAVAFVAHVVLSGTYFTAAMSLPAALLPRNRFAQFASAAFMLISLTTMFISPALGFIIDYTNKNFRLTFLAGLLVCVMAIMAMLAVYRRMQDYGGMKNYVAPGDSA
jgi:Na+/melibiose symporter-like transporter